MATNGLASNPSIHMRSNAIKLNHSIIPFRRPTLTSRKCFGIPLIVNYKVTQQIIVAFSENIYFQNTKQAFKRANESYSFTMYGSIGLARDRKDLKFERHHQHGGKRSAPPTMILEPPHHAPESPMMSKLMIMATSSVSTLMAPTPPLFREENKQDDSQQHH